MADRVWARAELRGVRSSSRRLHRDRRRRTRSITGRLDGEILRGEFAGAECVWLVGPSGERTQLLLFDEEMVVFEPLRLVDPGGAVIARAGDIVTVTGPSSAIGETICAPGEHAFSVDVIEGPEGTYSFPTMPPF